MEVEIDVNVEVLSVEVFVGASADVRGIVEQIRYPGDLADLRQEVRRLHHAIELLIRRPNFRDVRNGGFAADDTGLVHRELAVELREFVDQFLKGFGVE